MEELIQKIKKQLNENPIPTTLIEYIADNPIFANDLLALLNEIKNLE